MTQTQTTRCTAEAFALAAVREAGRRGHRGAGGLNNHPRDSLESYVWEAGYMRDVRSLEQLEAAWSVNPRYTPPVYTGS